MQLAVVDRQALMHLPQIQMADAAGRARNIVGDLESGHVGKAQTECVDVVPHETQRGVLHITARRRTSQIAHAAGQRARGTGHRIDLHRQLRHREAQFAYGSRLHTSRSQGNCVGRHRTRIEMARVLGVVPLGECQRRRCQQGESAESKNAALQRTGQDGHGAS